MEGKAVSVDPAILEKIRALYRLASDPCNEHEAALAADRVREMLAQYNLSLGEVLNEKSEGTERAGKYRGRIERHTFFLADACKFLFDVEWFVGYGGRIATRWGWRPGSGIVFCGIPQNVEAAIATVDYFEYAISALLIRQTSIHARKRKNCFRLGAAQRIAVEANKLKAAVAQEGPTMELVRLGNALAKRQKESHNLHSQKLRAPRMNQAFMAGYLAGGEVNLRGGVQKAVEP